MSSTVMLGTEAPEVAALAGALGCALEAMPDPMASSDLDWSWAAPLETWRNEASRRPPAEHVVLAPWAAAPAPAPLDDVDLEAWMRRSELALARWVAAFGAAKARCDDGGVIVAVVDRPAPLDCAGWAPETGWPTLSRPSPDRWPARRGHGGSGSTRSPPRRG